MPAGGPNFSPFPFDRLPRVSRRAAALETAIARHLAARPSGARLAALLGGPVRARLVGTNARPAAHAARAVLRTAGGASIVVAAPALALRPVVRRLLGGPDELGASRPVTTVEHAVWALVLAAAVADLGIDGAVEPMVGAIELAPDAHHAVELALDLAGVPVHAVAWCPLELAVRPPPPRPVPGWTFELPVSVARCVLARSAARALAVRDVVTVEPELGLELGGGRVRLRAAPGAVEATVAGVYVRSMATIDDAELELTVRLGTTRLSLRQLAELAVGQVIPLGRPLAGPYEIRAADRRVGEGELVDVDGELGVRIVSLTQE